MRMPKIRPVQGRASKTPRQRHTYRAARREEQKAHYRLMKRARSA